LLLPDRPPPPGVAHVVAGDRGAVLHRVAAGGAGHAPPGSPAAALPPAVAGVGAAASALDIRLSYYGGASITRLYEGTDTRCQDILVGAAMAIGMAMWAQHRRALPEGADPTPWRIPTPWFGPSIKPIAAWEITPIYARVALQVLGWSVLAAGVYLWSQLTEPSAFLFEGGFLLFALGVATVIF